MMMISDWTQVGDLSGRHGRIAVGGNAYVFNDEHLPLSGDWFMSALGKSVVIHNPDGGTDRMACANIEEEKDIVKVAAVRAKAGFSLDQFMEDVRGVMGVPDWFLYLDARETKWLDSCVRVKLHFAGPHANRLEQDFSRLLRTGKLDTPSLMIPGYVPDVERKTTLGYRSCHNGDNRPKKTSNYINDLYHSLTGGYGDSGAEQASTLSAFLLIPMLSVILS